MAGYVYFIDDGHGHIKIGKTSDMRNRLSNLQTANAMPLVVRLVLQCKTMADAGKLERKLHMRFLPLNVQNEWFTCNSEIDHFIQQAIDCNIVAISGVSCVVKGSEKKPTVPTRPIRNEPRPEPELELYNEAVQTVRRLNKASIGLLQRRLRIGYARAKRLITLMHVCGVIGPEVSGANHREIYRQ